MPRKGEHNPIQDYQVIDGIYFYKERTGNYYLGNVPDETGKKRPVRVHIYVWEKHHGKIPSGYHVHHFDGDTSNNDISNLSIITSHEHASMHAHFRADESAKVMETYARPAAIEWHQSAEGSEWHKKHYEEITRDKWNRLVTKKCIVCGKEYQVKSCAANRSKYCSPKCKNRSVAKADYKKTHMIKRICPICGKEFLAYKYNRQKTCGVECGKISCSRLKTGVKRNW